MASNLFRLEFSIILVIDKSYAELFITGYDFPCVMVMIYQKFEQKVSISEDKVSMFHYLNIIEYIKCSFFLCMAQLTFNTNFQNGFQTHLTSSPIAQP